jgi:hypothetical protein
MVYDFLHTCKTYSRDFYKKDYFKKTPCPACPSVGRFKLHGSYSRHAMFFDSDIIVYMQLEIKRIRCKSCKTTHAVMPGDIIPYKQLTFFVLMFILVSIYLKKKPVLMIAHIKKLSFQFIYCCVIVFFMHINRIHQYYKERAPTDTSADTDPESVVKLIRNPYLKFQSGYIKLNRRPCFMSKFFNGKGAPPVGLHAP